MKKIPVLWQQMLQDVFPYLETHYRLVHKRGRKRPDWYYWNGTVWENLRTISDAIPFVNRQLCEYYLDAYSRAKTDEERSYALRCSDKLVESFKFARYAMRSFTQSPQYHLEESAMNAQPHLINTPSGVVDVLQWKLLPHAPDYYMTKITAADFEPDASYPKWQSLLDALFETPDKQEHVRQLVVQAFLRNGDLRNAFEVEPRCSKYDSCYIAGTLFRQILETVLGSYAVRPLHRSRVPVIWTRCPVPYLTDWYEWQTSRTEYVADEKSGILMWFLEGLHNELTKR